ncbi:MAG: hypothetical protein FWG61_00505, partial [Firmicutes bacterium]|nr:hypothetical protein [Bacillota bacterium]
VELTIEDARFERMTWLQTMIDATLDLSVIDSSLGFPINTNMQSLNDIVNFMVLLTDEGLENVAYHDANDEEHILDADEMRVLHGELSDFISGVSRKARILRGIINSAESFAELAQVQWDFVDISRLGGKRRGKRLLNNLI